MSVRISVITPTYNRAGLLPGVFESIGRSSVEGIEWIVVDDASSDETEAVVAGLSEGAGFPVEYRRCARNGGKQRALNLGVPEARGELSVVIDSDDELVDRALDLVWDLWAALPGADRSKLGGIVGLSVDSATGAVIGDRFPSDRWEASIIESRVTRAIGGDKCEFWRTDLLKLEPFPEIEGERFVPEGVVWNRIGRTCRMINVNIPLQKKAYLEGGLSDRFAALACENPTGFRIMYEESLRDPMPLRYKAAHAAAYWSFAKASGVSLSRRLAALGAIAPLGLSYLAYSKLKAAL